MRFALIVLAALAVAAGAAPARAQLVGEPEAVQRVDAMLEAMGGKSVWAETRSLYLVYDQWRDDPDRNAGGERAWRDLAEPYERLEWRWGDDRVRSGRAFTPEGGWRAPTGAAPAPLAPTRHRQYLAFWQRDFYTMIRRFAREDPALRLRMSAPSEVQVSLEDGHVLGWWRIDTRGNLTAWRAFGSTGDLLSYVYGPYKAYGRVRFPAWGSTTAGDFRFEYRDVAISAEPIPAAVFAHSEAEPSASLTLSGGR